MPSESPAVVMYREITMSTIQPTPRTKVCRIPGRADYERTAVEAILDEGLICHVAFVVDGKPYLIPTAYARDGRSLYLHGAKSNRMLRAIIGGETCISVTLLDGLVLARSVMHHSMNYRSVVIFGKGEEVTDPEQKLHALHCVVEHIIPGRWADARQPNDQEFAATLVVRVPLDECSAKVRKGPPVDDEEDLQLPVWAGVIPTKQSWMPPKPDEFLTQPMEVPAYAAAYSRPAKSE